MKNAHDWKDKIESKVDMTLDNFSESEIDERIKRQDAALAKEAEKERMQQYGSKATP